MGGRVAQLPRAGHRRGKGRFLATDAPKALNVPYDNGIAIVANAEAMYAAMGAHAAYLIQDERPDPLSTVPEFSRRARGFTVWAALRSLGRRGVAEMVERFCAHARRFAAGLAQIEGVRVVNDVVFTQVCVSFGSDEVTREVAARLLKDGTAWMTPSTWHGVAVLRISVSNWRTTDEDVDPTLAAVRRVLAEVVRDDLSAGWPLVQRPRVPAPRRLQRSPGCHRGQVHRDGPRGSCRRSTTRCCRSLQSRPRYGFVRQLVG